MTIIDLETLTRESQFAKPILITGAPRSGTTWVGRMLAVSDRIHYIHEPFNPDSHIDNCIFEIEFSHHMIYITEEIDGCRKKYYKPFKKLIKGRCGPWDGLSTCKSISDILHVHMKQKEYLKYSKQGIQPLIKDPIALMSAGWLARSFDIYVIVMIRHPAAFVASMKRLGWTFEPLNWALSQPMLLRDYLSPFEAELREVAESNTDIIDRLALMWKTIYFVVRKYQAQYPNWIYLRHEDIAKDPVLHFAKLYRKFGLDFSDHAKDKIDEYTNATNPPNAEGNKKEIKLNSKKVISYWKRALSGQEVKRIKEIVCEVSKYYYSDSDWELDDIS